MYKSGTEVEEAAGVGYPIRSPDGGVDVDVSKFEMRKRGVNLIGLEVDWNLKFQTSKLHSGYKNGFRVWYAQYTLHKMFKRESAFDLYL